MLQARAFITARSSLINYRLIKQYSSVVNDPPTEKPTTSKNDYANVLAILSSTKRPISLPPRPPLESVPTKTPDGNPNSGHPALITIKKLLRSNKMDNQKRNEIVRHFMKLDLLIPEDGVDPLSFLSLSEWINVLNACRVTPPEERVKLLRILERRFQKHKVYRDIHIVNGLSTLYSDIGNVEIVSKLSLESKKKWGISDPINIGNIFTTC